MTETVDRINAIIAYARTLRGDEKGEAQVFCDRLFKAFGHGGYREAGATLEFRVRERGRSTKFVDLLWPPRLLLEMKKRGTRLERHYDQAFQYWIHLVPDRPRYVVLCNFDDFWIYDFNVQLDEPVDRVALADLADRYTALNFLFPDEREPQFGNNRVDVTRKAADKVAAVFKALVARGEDRDRAQRFVLQCVVAMFSEDFELLPLGLFTQVLDDCIRGDSAFDLIGNLFRQMNSRTAARGGRFRQVEYFNGGLFAQIDPIELNGNEVALLRSAAEEHWAHVAPPIFGTLFQNSMDDARRHSLGAHFTSEVDIQSVVLPTIVRPWKERIDQANTLEELNALTRAILRFRVLDPACGSGNFLYIAYRELVKLEMEILSKIHDNFGSRARRRVGTASLVSSRQFFGIDKDHFAVELAKVTLMLGKRITLAEAHDNIFAAQRELPLTFDDPLPLDNLDDNIRQDDALMCEWPDVDAIIGNPPYQSKNKMQEEYGRAYLNRLRDRYPEVPGKADYCVYWFRRTHDELGQSKRAGLVGTNTIRQNNSREGGLDYIVANQGTILDAVSSQHWSGDAQVQVSIVNWIKGDQTGQKILRRQLGERTDSPWELYRLDRIGAALSGRFDVTQAAELRANKDSDTSDQGQTQGHSGFVLSIDEGREMLAECRRNAQVIFPYLGGDDFLGSIPPSPQKFVIDFHPRDILEAQRFEEPFEHVREAVLESRQSKAQKEEERNEEARRDNPTGRVNQHHRNFLRRWWMLSYPRGDLKEKLSRLTRYIVCSRVTKRPVFVFVDAAIHPNDSLQVFTFEDDYSFGILQSNVHWTWFVERCSTLTERFRYTSETVYDSFPWPQSPTLAQARQVVRAARAVRDLRERAMNRNGWTLRELYRSMEMPGENPLKDVHATLDAAVRAAYGMRSRAEPLEFIFKLNQLVAEREASMQRVVGPGLPPCVRDRRAFVSDDRVEMR
jgi:hypothetical protein